MLPAFLRRADDFNRDASAWLEECVRGGARSVFLPAGRTPESLYALWERERPEWLERIMFKQIDDVMNGPQAGMFRKFFEQHLPSYLRQFEWIDQADSRADVAIHGVSIDSHDGGGRIEARRCCAPVCGLDVFTCDISSRSS